MANARANLKQVDVTRTLKGALAAGMHVGKIVVDPSNGTIVVFPVSGEVDPVQAPNPWDDAFE